jgi:hypothetical protein
MGNATEKNQQNAGQRKPDVQNPNDPTRRNPSQSGEQRHNPQDPSRKNPAQDTGPGDNKDREGSEDVEKRRVS